MDGKLFALLVLLALTRSGICAGSSTVASTAGSLPENVDKAELEAILRDDDDNDDPNVATSTETYVDDISTERGWDVDYTTTENTADAMNSNEHDSMKGSDYFKLLAKKYGEPSDPVGSVNDPVAGFINTLGINATADQTAAFTDIILNNPQLVTTFLEAVPNLQGLSNSSNNPLLRIKSTASLQEILDDDDKTNSSETKVDNYKYLKKILKLAAATSFPTKDYLYKITGGFS